MPINQEKAYHTSNNMPPMHNMGTPQLNYSIDHIAAKLGLNEVYVALADHGADYEKGDQEDKTPLMIAEENGHLITKVLE